MKLSLKHIPTATAFYFGIFVSLLTCGVYIYQTVHNRSAQYNQHYVQALSMLAASQAADSMFSSDLVGLQMLAQDVAKQPYVIRSAIFDVENNLLAQSGAPTLNPEYSFDFTSPIILENAIAGYATVITHPPYWLSTQQTLFFVFTMMVFGGLGFWSLIGSGAIVIEPRRSMAPPDTEQTQKDISSDDEAQIETETSIESQTPESHVYAVIHVKNLAVLQEQLSGDNYRKTLGRLERIISDVLALYSGRDFYLQDNAYILALPYHDSASEAYFRAICCAYLVLEIAGIVNKVPLDLAALVTDAEFENRHDPLPIAGLHVEAAVAEDHTVSHRLELLDINEGSTDKVVAGFAQPFKTLLENQRAQLHQIL